MRAVPDRFRNPTHLPVRTRRQWRRAGYRLKLIFLSLAREELAIERVAVRVVQGGHAVPEAVIRRRFAAGWKNFRDLYRRAVDRWQLYDNSGEAPVLLEEGP